MWADQVRSVLDAVAALRVIAGSPAVDPKAAVEAANRAYALENDGPGGVAARPADQKSATAAWSDLTGVDYTTEAGKAKVYAAVAEMRKRELERQGRAAAVKQKAQAKPGRRRAR